ncbi:asparaginase [Limnohabitans sp.]|uniref:asparaginase n=1 Tax=Limnohabitans sp. TaxID=1907725 RepID=UPI0038BB6732
MSAPRILIVSLGGTITMTRSDAGGITPTLTADKLIDSVPQLAGVATLEAITQFSMPGASLSIRNLADVAELLNQRLQGDIDGAVVVQGTDTIEDTAFVLDLLVRSPRPVVVTGAMRGPQAAGADGPANILSAVTVAADARLRGMGVVVVLNDEIHSARWAQKSHTALTSAFTSPGTGCMGFVAEGRVELMMTPQRHIAPIQGPLAHEHAVAQVSLGLGEDARMLPTLQGLGYSGAVIEGMGAGHVPAASVGAVVELMQQMPVVLCTRVRGGRVFTQTYGFAGSEMDLMAKGIIPCGHLSASKARLLLSLLLATGTSPDGIRQAFARTTSA